MNLTPKQLAEIRKEANNTEDGWVFYTEETLLRLIAQAKNEGLEEAANAIDVVVATFGKDYVKVALDKYELEVAVNLLVAMAENIRALKSPTEDRR